MRTLLISLLLLSNSNLSYYMEGTTVSNIYKNNVTYVQPESNQLKLHSTTLFNKKLRKRESTNDWRIVNKFGYIGHYQFGKEAREATGYGYVTTEKFIENPNIWPPEEQEKAMNKLIKINKKILRKYIEQYSGDTINGIVITESGLLAAAHIAGAGSVKKKTGVIGFLLTRGANDPQDKFGTKLSTYLSEFANL